MLLRDHYVPIGEIKLFYREIVPEDQHALQFPVIVFLHEGLGSVGQWKDFPEKLVEATGFSAIVYDRQGYGKSSPRTEKRGLDYIHQEEKLLQKFINALSLKSYLLVGHSEGGSLGLIHASRHPKGLLKVVTLSANTFNEPKISASIRKVMEIYEKPDSKLRNGLLKYHGEKTDDVFYAWSKTWTAPFFQQWNIFEELEKIELPVQSFHGKNDRYTSLEQIENIRKMVSAPKEINILDCSHHPHFDRPVEVVKKIADYLKQN